MRLMEDKMGSRLAYPSRVRRRLVFAQSNGGIIGGGVLYQHTFKLHGVVPTQLEMPGYRRGVVNDTVQYEQKGKARVTSQASFGRSLLYRSQWWM